MEKQSLFCYTGEKGESEMKRLIGFTMAFILMTGTTAFAESKPSRKELDVLENRLNINNSDVDLFEFEGKTHIFYASGDQMTYSFLCEAVYDGPPEEFLEAFFKTAD